MATVLAYLHPNEQDFCLVNWCYVLIDKMPSMVNFFDAVECLLKINPYHLLLIFIIFNPLIDPRARNRNRVIRGAPLIFT